MERARQLVGEMLIYCFAVVAITGAYLTFFYTPSGEEILYSGSYPPLHGVSVSAAYNSVLGISLDVRGGLFVRQLHHHSAYLLVLGAGVWGLLGRFRYAIVVLGLGAVAVLGGYGAADDLLSGTVLAKVPVPVWFGLHLLAALVMVVELVVSARREAAGRPRTLRFVALGIVLTALAVLYL